MNANNLFKLFILIFLNLIVFMGNTNSFSNTTVCEADSGAYQILSLVVSNKEPGCGEALKIDVKYQTTNDRDDQTGLGFRVHFDSEYLEFVKFENPYYFNKISGPEEWKNEVNDNFDNDINTDKCYILGYGDQTLDGWPSCKDIYGCPFDKIVYPLPIVSYHFIVKKAYKTQVNISLNTNDISYCFKGDSITINENKEYTTTMNPLITEINPKSGRVGDLITITGTKFDEVNKVFFGDEAVDVIPDKNSNIVTCNIPQNISPEVQVNVQTSDCLRAFTPTTFKYLHQIKLIEPDSGSIESSDYTSSNGIVLVEDGKSFTFEINAQEPDIITNISINGKNIIDYGDDFYKKVDNTFTIKSINCDYTITTRTMHQIIADSNDNGSINPVGIIYVYHNSDQSFEFNPNPDYSLEKIIIDDKTIEGNQIDELNNIYKLESITKSKNITFVFSQTTFTILTEFLDTNDIFRNSYGTISPTGYTNVKKISDYTFKIDKGLNQTFLIQSDDNYSIKKIFIDRKNTQIINPKDIVNTGDNSEIINQCEYTFENVNANHQMWIEYYKSVFNINTNITLDDFGKTHGSISPSGSIPVTINTDKTFTFDPHEHYQIKSLFVNKKQIPDITNSYTFRNIKEDNTIEIEFEKKNYSINLNFTGNGYVDVYVDDIKQDSTKQIFALYEQDVRFDFIADDCQNITINDNENELSLYNNDSYTITKIDQNHNLEIKFEPKILAVNTSVNNKNFGQISNSEHYICGTNVINSFTPNYCYEMEKIVINENTINESTIDNPKNSYTILEIKDNYNIKAYFKIKSFNISFTTGGNGCFKVGDLCIINETYKINCFEQYPFKILPSNESYKIELTIQNEPVSLIDNSYTLTNIQSDYDIHADFKPYQELTLNTENKTIPKNSYFPVSVYYNSSLNNKNLSPVTIKIFYNCEKLKYQSPVNLINMEYYKVQNGYILPQEDKNNEDDDVTTDKFITIKYDKRDNYINNTDIKNWPGENASYVETEKKISSFPIELFKVIFQVLESNETNVNVKLLDAHEGYIVNENKENNLTINNGPVINEIIPKQGSIKGQNLITIKGKFCSSSERSKTKIFLDTVELEIKDISETEISFIIPKHEAGQVSIIVEDSNGLRHSTNYTYIDYPPVISSIEDQEIDEDKETSKINFQINDKEGDFLSIKVKSSNSKLVPSDFDHVKICSNNDVCDSEKINIDPSNEQNFYLKLFPAENMYGISLIKVIVNDGTTDSIEEFWLKVNNVNDTPKILLNDDFVLETNEDENKTFELIIEDVDKDIVELSLEPFNYTLIKIDDINNPNKFSITIIPDINYYGEKEITVYASDNLEESSKKFILKVNSVYDPPDISRINDIEMNEDTEKSISFEVTSVEKDADIKINVKSSNTDLFNESSFIISDSDLKGIKNLALKPVENQFGSAEIVLTASDNDLSVKESFIVTVKNVYDPLEIKNIENQKTGEDNSLSVTFHIINLDMLSNSLISIIPSSDNPDLIPDNSLKVIQENDNEKQLNITYKLNITPLPDKYGKANITILASDGQTDIKEETFQLDVIKLEDNPIIKCNNTNIEIDEDQQIKVRCQVFDAETDPEKLKIEFMSNNTDLIDNNNIEYEIQKSDRPITITTKENENGEAIVTIKVVDESERYTSISIMINVTSVNDPPYIFEINDNEIIEDSKFNNYITISDPDGDNLTIVSYSSDESIIPINNIIISGEGDNKEIKIVPKENAYGSVSITLCACDSNTCVYEPFVIKVKSDNDPPTITKISDKTIDEDSQVTIDFSIGDVETNAANLNLTCSSSDNNIIPIENLVINGNGKDRSLEITPLSNKNGDVKITITVDDGEKKAYSSFNLKINPINDVPEISNILINNEVIYDLNCDEPEELTTNEGVPINVTFYINDIETNSNDLNIEAITQKINGNYFLDDGISILRSESDSNLVTMIINPVVSNSGKMTITLYVTDPEGLSACSNFKIFVKDINKPPLFELSQNSIIKDEDFVNPVIINIIPSQPDDEKDKNEDIKYELIPEHIDLVELLLENNKIIIKSWKKIDTDKNITVDSNLFGDSIITVKANDLQDENNTYTQSFSIQVKNINDPPEFVFKKSKIILAEDFAEKITNDVISYHPENEKQQVIYSIDTKNCDLANLTIDSNSGRITITSKENQNGSQEIIIRASDGIIYYINSFVLQINEVNDPPYIIIDSEHKPFKKKEDFEPIDYTINAIDVDGDSLNYSISIKEKDNSSIVSYSIDKDSGIVHFESIKDEFGTKKFEISASDGDYTDKKEFILYIESVNDLPVITSINIPEVNRDENNINKMILYEDSFESQKITVTVWQPENEKDQIITCELIPEKVDWSDLNLKKLNNETFIISINKIDDENGESKFNIKAYDNKDYSVPKEFTINIESVNDPPALELKNQHVINEDSGLQIINDWVTEWKPGPDNEKDQIITSKISTDNDILFENMPQIINKNSLIYMPKKNAYGTAIVSVTLTDDGGTANGGKDTTTEQFTITIKPVNDPPAFSINNKLTNGINANAGKITITDWIYDIDMGAENESNQSYTFTATIIENPEIIVGEPQILSNGTLIFEPEKTKSGNATIRVTLQDSGGIENGGDDDIYHDDNISINTCDLRILTNIDDIPQLNQIYEVGDYFEAKIEVECGYYPYSFAVDKDDKLPNGLEIDSTGKIYGYLLDDEFYSKNDVNSITFKITVTDSANKTEYTPDLTIKVVNKLKFESDEILKSAIRGIKYPDPIKITGGEGPYTFDLSDVNGKPMDNIVLNDEGYFSQIPSETGQYSFTVYVEASCGHAITKTFLLKVVDPIEIYQDELYDNEIDKMIRIYDGILEIPYNMQLTITGGYGDSYTIVEDPKSPMPEGLSIDSSGHITGTPTNVSSSIKTTHLTIYDTEGHKKDFYLQYRICEKLEIQSQNFDTIQITGKPFSEQLSWTGGFKPYYFVYSSNNSQDITLSISNTGVINGLSNQDITYDIEITVSDSSFTPFTQTADTSFKITFIKNIKIETEKILPDFFVGSEIKPIELKARGGEGSYSWYIKNLDKAPPGLYIIENNDHYELHGQPLAEGQFDLTICVKASIKGESCEVFNSRIYNPLYIRPFQQLEFYVGKDNSYSFGSEGGCITKTWEIDGNLDWLNLDPQSGIVRGKPGEYMSPFDLTLKVKDNCGNTSQKKLNIQVLYEFEVVNSDFITPITNCNESIADCYSLSVGYVGHKYNIEIDVYGGKQNYTWEYENDQLIEYGLEFVENSKKPMTLSIIGEPSKAGLIKFPLKVLDSSAPSKSINRLYFLRIKQINQATIITKVLDKAVKGEQYRSCIEIDGAISGYTLTITEGSLPCDLIFQDKCITGFVNDSCERSSIKIKLEDLNGEDEEDFVIDVVDPLDTETHFEKIKTLQWEEYWKQLKVKGGIAPYQWLIKQGSFPDCIKLNPLTGEIYGISTEDGDFGHITLTVQDSSAKRLTKDITIDEFYIVKQNIIVNLKDIINALKIISGINDLSCDEIKRINHICNNKIKLLDLIMIINTFINNKNGGL